MIQTKCIFATKSNYDGLRVSIMSRHTLNDGKTPDKRIQRSMYDIHCVDLAPSPKLVGAFYRGEVSFDEYVLYYIQYLRSTKVLRNAIEAIAHWALVDNMTFLCQEEFPQRCHRSIFAKECKRCEPKLNIILH